MARVKFVVPADYDKAEYEKRVKALSDSGKYADAIALLAIMEKVDAVSVPGDLPEEMVELIPDFPDDLDAAMRKENGSEKDSKGIGSHLVIQNGKYFVVSYTVRRVTEDQRKDWQLK